jgi:hypothetical protein
VASEESQLGQIERIDDIRGVWKHEAAAFTPWLLANANVVGSALGIEISLEAADTRSAASRST